MTLSHIPFDQVIKTHQERYRPTSDRFNKDNSRYWGAIYPTVALTTDAYPQLAVWIESFKRRSDNKRAYIAKVIDMRTGQIQALDLSVGHFPGYDMYAGDPNKTKVAQATQAYLMKLEKNAQKKEG